jgi:hypothetical protein
MKAKIRILCKQVLILLVLVILMQGSAIAQNKKNDQQQSPFKYGYPINREVKYRETTVVNQTMDINGQSMENKINTYTIVTLKNTGASGINSILEVRIDTLAQTLDTPAGFNGGPIQDIAGKTFKITIDPSGKEIDNSEAGKISFTAAGGTSTSALQLIESFFPVLPETVIKQGYTWNTSDSINSRTPAMVTLGTVISENTFAGFEIFNGVNCAKFTSALSGQRIMTTQSQGMDIKMSGPYTGTISSFFSLQNGYFLKQDIITKMTGTIDITGPQEMSFPLVMEINVTKEVIN